MNFQQLYYFVILCESGNVTKAAEKLYITQQALSASIAKLENELSCKLFDRTPKGVALTEGGKYFLDWSTDILLRFQSCHAYFNSLNQPPQTIRCVGVQGTLCEFAMDLISKFEREYPCYMVQIREMNDLDCDEAVYNGTVEVGFGVEPFNEENFEYCTIFRSKQICLLPESHPLARLETIPIEKLQNETLITVDEGFKALDHFLKKCTEKGVPIIPKYRVGEVIGVHRLVSENRGVGISNVSTAQSLSTPNTVWRYIELDDIDWALAVFKRKGQKLSPGADTFYEYVKRQLATDLTKKIDPSFILH